MGRLTWAYGPTQQMGPSGRLAGCDLPRRLSPNSEGHSCQAEERDGFCNGEPPGAFEQGGGMVRAVLLADSPPLWPTGSRVSINVSGAQWRTE